MAPAALQPQTINLPTSKQLVEPVPGEPQRLNSLPMTAAISPDGRYLAVVNAGYGTYQSRFQQSIAVLDLKTGKLLWQAQVDAPAVALPAIYTYKGKEYVVFVAGGNSILEPKVSDQLIAYALRD